MSLRTLPLRLEVRDDESVDSWLEALSRRYGISPRSMLALLGLDCKSDYIGTMAAKLDAAAWTSAERAARLPSGVLYAAAGGDYSTVSALPSGGSRFCPRCLDETGGRWRLWWRLNWSVACTRHRLLLVERCPACASPQRTRVPGGKTPVDPATCTQSDKARGRCGADLTLARASAADDRQLEAQRWVTDQLEQLRGPDSQQAEQLFADLPIVVSWLARRAVPEDVARGRRGYRTVPAANARVTAGFLATARILLTGSDEEAIAAFQEVATTFPANGYRIPPPGMGHRRWRALGPVFPNRYLRAVDAALQTGDRLRTKSVIPTAARISTGPNGRARMLPQLLWPEWTARLLPRAGFRTGQFRAALSASTLLPGAPARNHARIAAQLNPHLSSSSITTTMQGIADIDGEASLRPVLIAICRIADFLDEHGSLIDYQRRRQVTAAPIMTWERWRDMACGAEAHPGDNTPTGRFLHAQRHLHQLLSGNDFADPTHPLAFHGSADRARYHDFAATLTTVLRRAFYQEAERFLTMHEINEPVTWHARSS